MNIIEKLKSLLTTDKNGRRACPMCGKHNNVSIIDSDNPSQRFSVGCEDQFCVCTLGFFNTIDEAEDAWNTRTSDPIIQAAIEEMERKHKKAPVQGFAEGIPWEMHLRAYEVYSEKWGKQPAMIDLEGRNCRGGFSTGELDGFIPNWRQELSEIEVLKKQLAERDVVISAMRDGLEAWEIIEKLRKPEAHTVTILCDNPDYNGQQNNAVDVCGDYTDWKEKRFSGDTILDCLKQALAESDKEIHPATAKRYADLNLQDKPQDAMARGDLICGCAQGLPKCGVCKSC